MIGYVAVEFVSHWDSEENASRLVASGLKFGLGSEFLGNKLDFKYQFFSILIILLILYDYCYN